MKDVNKLITEYIEAQPSPQKEILRRIRSLIRNTLPGIEEEFKMGVPWYEGKFYLVGLKDHVNIGFCIDKLSRAELAPFEGRGKLMRHIKIRSLEEIDRKKLIPLLKLVNSRN